MSSKHKINIRDMSIRCGACHAYQTLSGFEPADGYNVYTYECENDTCDPAATRTLVEVPAVLDLFYQKHPDCGGPED
jgi:hypothetical protein